MPALLFVSVCVKISKCFAIVCKSNGKFKSLYWEKKDEVEGGVVNFQDLNSELLSLITEFLSFKHANPVDINPQMCFSFYQGRKQSTLCKVGQMLLVLDNDCSGRSDLTLPFR